jgi:hypothetical protein
MKISHFLALSIAGVSQLFLIINQAQAQTQRTFLDPYTA